MIERPATEPMTEPKADLPAATGWGVALLLAAVIAAMWLGLAGSSTLFDRDEPRFSRAAVEMVESGNYLVPYFNGDLRPHKPVLIYWFMSASIHALGETDFACRFVSPVASALTALVVFWLGSRLFSRRAGLWAMAVLLLNPLMIQDGQAAIADAVLLLFMTLSMACFAWGLMRGFSGGRVLCLGLALGLALLAKGPVAMLIVLSMLWALRLLKGSEDEEAGGSMAPPARSARRVFVAVGIGLVLFLGWAVPAVIDSPQLVTKGLIEEGLSRLWMQREGHGGQGVVAYLATIPTFYPLTVLVGFFPWVALLPAVVAVRSETMREWRGRRLLLAWAVPIFVFMCFVPTKLPHYVLPIWPALALGVGELLDRAGTGRMGQGGWRWAKRGTLIGVLLSVLLWGPALVVGVSGPAIAESLVAASQGSGVWLGIRIDKPIEPEWVLLMRSMRWAALLLGGLMLVMSVGATVLVWRERLRSAAWLLGAGMVGVVLSLMLVGLPAFESFKLAPPLGEVIRERLPRGATVTTIRYDDPSLVFYVNRGAGNPVQRMSANEAAIRKWGQEAEPGALVLEKALVEEAFGERVPAGVAVVAPLEHRRMDSSGRWRELVVLIRGAVGDGE